MTQCLIRIWTEEKAQNLPEFALLLFLVCLTAVSAMGGVAIKVNTMYSQVSTHVAAAGNPALTGGPIGYASEAPAQTKDESKDARKSQPND